MKSFIHRLLAGALVLFLAACGGGEGSPKFNIPGLLSTNSTDSTTAANQTSASQTTPTLKMEIRSGAGVETNSISVTEISQVLVTVKNAAGQPVPGVVVTFSETGAGLLSFAPVSKTALTDTQGAAVVEVRAATASSTSAGATTISASATVSGAVASDQKSIGITTSPSVVVVAPNPQAQANALNFLDVNPADKSIVPQGAGGNGRSESATLRFRVVDKSNIPVKGALVTFAVDSTAVTLNIPQATSDADGVVVTTVSSKSVATVVVIQATVTRADGSTIKSPSDTLTVTNDVATVSGFDLSATKYNLNFGLSGDKAVITVGIVGKDGHPVADGLPVVFTAPFGAVGTSSRGGCVTVNGRCSVDYVVQNPRPADGQPAPVTASTLLSDGTPISGILMFNFADLGRIDLYSAATGGSQVTTFKASTCAKQTFSAFAGTSGGSAAPADTAVTVNAFTSGFTSTLKSSSPVADQSILFTRTAIDFEVDLSGLTAVPCDATQTSIATAYFDVKFKAAVTPEVTRRIAVTYPTAP